MIGSSLENLSKSTDYGTARCPHRCLRRAPSVVSNATNGITPRDYLSVKKSKKGPLKQIVPGYPHLKSKYTLLWDMLSNEGYIKVKV